MSFRKKAMYEYLDYLREIKLAVGNFIVYLFLFTNHIIMYNQHLSVYRVLSSNVSRKLESLDKFKNLIVIFLR